MPPSAGQAVYIGVDIGTSGVRAVAIAEDGAELAAASVGLEPPARPADGTSTQQPETWWRAVVTVLRLLTADLGEADARCLAVDGTSSSLLLTDLCGRPLTRALMYDDRRSRHTLARIRALATDASAVHSASSSLAKLLHLHAGLTHTDEFLALHQADWILGRLTGRFGISDENNCLKLGYDAALRRWPGWMAEFGFPLSALPQVHPAGTPVGPITAEAARQCGLPESCLVATGTTDSTAAALACGIREAGEAVTSLGSTLALKVLSTRPVFAAEYGVYSHRVGDLWLAGGASNSGGAVLAKFFSPEEMAILSARIDPGVPSGLDYYPLLRAGERFPINDPDLPPGMSPRPRSDTLFFQGLLEGIARIERKAYTLLAELGAPTPSVVYSVGGGAANAQWRQIREKLLGVPVLNATGRQAAHGCALLAREAMGRPMGKLATELSAGANQQ